MDTALVVYAVGALLTFFFIHDDDGLKVAGVVVFTLIWPVLLAAGAVCGCVEAVRWIWRRVA